MINAGSVDPGVVFILSREETDRMFDPFDILDNKLPSHLYHAGHRFIKQDVYDWMETHVGLPNEDWRHFTAGGAEYRGIRIEDPQKAMLFKLTWSL